jgi:4-amino-4-deoxy-L-arabinose transferase-like glycosyltransferase
LLRFIRVTESIGKVNRWRRIDWAMLALVMLIALSARFATTINRPLHRDPEGCGVYYGTLARNYFRHDIIKNFAVPIQSIGVNADAPVHYPNHPPLAPLLVAGTYAIFGWDSASNQIPPDWQTRLPTTLATLACTAAIFVMLRHRASLRAATLAAIIFSLLPMTLVFGSQPDVINTQLVFFALLTIAAYLRLHDAPSAARLALLCVAFLPAAATDWPAFYLVVVLGIHFIVTRPPRAWPWMIAFGFLSALVFFALYAQVVAVTHDWRWMSRLLARRALSSTSDANDVFTFSLWAEHALRGHALRRHTMVGFWLLACWTMLAMTRLRDARATRLILLVLGWAVLHIVVGRQGVFVHEWWWWPLTPAIAMASGVALDFALSLGKGVRQIVTTGIAVILLSIWGGNNLARALDELRHPYPMWSNWPELDYTVVEMGQAIRAAAPFSHPVMLAEKDETLGLWFYGDR